MKGKASEMSKHCLPQRRIYVDSCNRACPIPLHFRADPAPTPELMLLRVPGQRKAHNKLQD